MKRVKKLLCLVLALMMLVSVCATGFTAYAADIDAAESGAAYPTAADDFTWDNATVYFLLTDRFNNGNTSNDNSYNRGLNQNGSKATYNNVAAFQGGDFKGITQKIKDGYFDDLGVNAIWVAGWFEQVHGYAVGGDGKSSFAHYAYHGYYGLDYTELDKNYGTEAEFKEMIDTAHEHGIRIVLDVVMNHPGYNTIYDMNEYNFGTLKNGWQDVYYNFSKINQSNYHGVIDYNSDSNAWGRWWGSNWIRAGLAGYQGGDGSEQKGEVNYLPDFKTETTNTVDIPQILKTKWTKEGTYNAKVNEINSTMSKYGLSGKTVRNYLVAWYTKWVEEYGVDGFRCDTAKHVEMQSWKTLSDACTKALSNWRKANPNAAGAKWDEEFWMTGENFGQGVSNNDYYKNGFDSMINFSFSGNSQGNGCDGMKKNDLKNTYDSYASQINTNDNFNVLTYISSHDTGLCRNDLYYQGSALLLIPGGVQIYYGDETNRQYVDCSIHDHENRSFMNWASISSSSSNDAKILAHWQKVGQFRNNHVAVGAGSNKNIASTSGTAFSRTYNKNGVTDKVAFVISATGNTTVTVSGVFADGTTVRNAYDGKTATVSGGKVTFAATNGTILIEEAAGSTNPTNPTNPTTKPTEPDTKPTTPNTKPTNPSGTGTYAKLGDADLSDVVNVKDATLIQKFAADLETLTEAQKFIADVDVSTVVNVKDATAIQKFCADLPTGLEIGELVLIPGTGGSDTPSDPSTKPTDPVTDPTTVVTPGDTIDLTQLDGNVIVVTNNSYASPCAHTWTDGGDQYTEWPGTPMTEAGGGFYFVITNKNANRIIFNDNGNNQTQTPDLEIPGNFAIYDLASASWVGYLSDYVDVTKFPLDPSLLPNPNPNPNPDPNPDPDPGEGNYVYLQDDAGWGAAYCHYWSDASGSVWPGDQMESLGGGRYRFALGNDAAGNQYVNIVFNGGEGKAQTANLTAEFGKTFNNASNSWS